MVVKFTNIFGSEKTWKIWPRLSWQLLSSLWKTIENNFNELSTKKIGHRNKKSKNRVKKVIKYSTEGRKNKNQCLLFI